MEYLEFQRRLAQVKRMGGEQHRGPDFATYELKSARKDTPSMITLFTKAPKPRGVNTHLRERYGHILKVEIEASTHHRNS